VRTYLEDPEILLGEIPEIDTLVGLEVESQLASIPRSLSALRATATTAAHAGLTTDTRHPQ
jgi:hypothetical protein